MKYSYQAKDISGKKIKGIMEARSKEAVLDFLASENLFPIEVVEGGEKTGKDVMKQEITFFEKISPTDVAVFSRQLAIMLASSVPLADAIEALGDQTKKVSFKNKIYKISRDVREGTSLSKALSKYPKIFSTFYVNIVKSGEVSGNLPSILEKVADHLENENEIKSKVSGAMVYPAVILVIFILIFAVIMIFVIPGLVEVLRSAGQELPIATQIIITISDFFVNYWYIILLVLVGGAILIINFLKTKTGKELFDRLTINMPIIGGFLKGLYLSRFAENFSTLIAAGITVNEALEVVAGLIDNSVYRDAILAAQKKVVKGESITSALEDRPDIFSPLFIQMISVGEKTGKLDTSLDNVVKFYKRETDVFVNSLSSIIQPVLIIGLALIVGFLVAAVLLPIYQVSTSGGI